MGNRNNGLLDQQIQTLLNTGGQDRLQQAQLNFGIPTYDRRTMPTSVFRPTFQQRQSARDQIIAEALANQDQRAIDPETARQNYLDQFNLGLQTLRPLGVDFVNDQPRGSDMDISVQRDLAALPEDTTPPTEETPQKDMTVVSPEDFIMQRVSPGSQAFPAGTTRPADTTDEDDADADRDPPPNILDLFDNKQALGKIALGVALLEGMPIDDAYDSFAPETSQALEIEAYNPITGQIFYGAQDDPSLLALQQEGFEIAPFGTRAKQRDDETKFRRDVQKLEIKEYNDARRESDALLRDAERLYDIVQKEGFESGFGTETKLVLNRIAKSIGLGTDMEDEETFKRIISRLIPQIRPTGAGSTSDFEIQLYTDALPSLGLDPDTNAAILEELILATRINVARNRYVASVLLDDVNADAGDTERSFSDLINIVMDSYEANNDNFGFTISKNDLSDDERELLSSIYTFVDADDINSEEEPENADRELGPYVVILGD